MIGYSESHHIIPVCLFKNNRNNTFGWIDGDSNDPSNIISLTPREHFICHLLLLPKMVENIDAKNKLTHALFAMQRRSKNQNRYILSSWEYQYVKNEFSKSRKGIGRPQTDAERKKRSQTLMGHILSDETKKKIGDANRGKSISEEGKANMRLAQQNRPPQTEETKRKRSNTLMGHFVSEETKKKISNKNLGKVLSDEQKDKISDSVSNLIWINYLNIKALRILPEKLQSYLDLGWRKGRGSVLKKQPN